MSLKDTQLLGEILSVQKALLSKLDKEEKRENEKDKKAGPGNVEAKVEAQGFTAMISELQDLNKTAKQQLDVLNSIKEKVGGTGMSSGSSGGSSISKGSGEKLGDLGSGLVSLGLGIISIVGGIALLALIAPIVPIAIIGALGVGIIVYGFYKLFEQIGSEKVKESVDNGISSLYRMAGGVALFTLAVVVSAAVLGTVGIPALLGLVLTIAGFAAVFYLLGQGEKSIKDGAQAAVWMGLGMAAIGLGVLVMVMSLKAAGDIIGSAGGSVLIGGIAALGIVAVSGITFFILGEFSKPIIQGALAVAAIGLGLAVFGIGLTVYLSGIAKIMGVGGEGAMGGTKVSGGVFDTIGTMLVGYGIITVGAITLVIYGTIFALAGLFEFGVPLMIAAGAGAYALAGLGLVFFGLGLDFYLGVIAKNVGVGGEGKEMTISADSFTSGLAVMGGALGYLIGIGAIFALAGVVSPLIGFGALAMAGVGLAMISLGYGIAKFIEYVPPGSDIGNELKDNLLTIKDAFLALVTDEPKGGLLGFADALIGGGVVGAISGGGKLVVAIGVAMGIGPALSSIAAGIGAWADLQNVPKVLGYDKMGQPIFDKANTADVETAMDNITTYLPGIIKPFIDLSNKANLGQETSLLSLVTGIQLSSSPFARGVSIAGEIGPVLSSMAQGIGAFASLTQSPKFTGYDAKGQPIFDKSQVVNLLESADNIGEAITAVMKPFIDLSTSAALGQEPSLLSVVTGIQLSESPFARGVSVAGSIGAVLSSLAQGIGNFAKLEQSPRFIGYDEKGQPIYDASKVVNILDSISNFAEVVSPEGSNSIIKPFIDLSNNAALKEGQSLMKMLTGADFGESPFQRGVGLTGKIGGVLSSLAQGISVFGNLSQAPKITGYNEVGQPIFSSSEVVDIEASIAGLADVLSPDGDNSVMKPFIALANNAALDKPFSLVGAVTDWIFGAGSSGGESDFEKGLRLSLSMGEVISNISAGIGQLGNLSAVPVITGYDAQGRATYGPPVNAMNSMKNLGILFEDLITSFAEAGRKMSPYADASQMEAIGPMVGGILGGIVESIDIFSNPNKLKKIKSYDEKGKPVYYTDEFVDVDTVIGNMIGVVLRIIRALGTDEIDDAMDELDLTGEGMAIGGFLDQFIKPITAFSKIISNLTGGSTSDLYDLTDQIVYATIGMVKQFIDEGDMYFGALNDTVTAITEFSEKMIPVWRNFMWLDQIQFAGVYKSDTNPTGSSLIGIADNISISINTIVAAFAPDETMPQLQTAATGSRYIKGILSNMDGFPKYMKSFLQAKPNEFGEGAKAAFDGLFVITQIAKDGQGKGFTHMKLFTDQINRLANIASPFERFADAFGKMSRDMKVFAENFKLMDQDGIYAFKEWTDSINILSTANPATFAANVITANNAIDAGFNAGEDPSLVDTIIGGASDLVDAINPFKKKETIDKNVKSGNENKSGTQQQTVQKGPTAAEIGSAVAAALKNTTLDVSVVNPESRRGQY